MLWKKFFRFNGAIFFFYKRAGFVSNKLILSKIYDGNILKIFQLKREIQIAIVKTLCTKQQNLKKDQLK